MATISFRKVNKIYDNKFHAVHDFDLEVQDKEFIVFVGPSGCGKSTTLRMIAGFEDISSGEIYIDNTKINTLAPKDRDIAMVFQNYALYPHMTVYDNMAFGLRNRKVPTPLMIKKRRAPLLLKKEQNDDKEFTISDRKRLQLKALLEKCKKKEVEIILVCSPIYRISSDKHYGNKALASLCHEVGVEYLDFSQEPIFLEHSEWFSDGSHMNYVGANEYI